MHGNCQYTTFLTWFCENFTATACLTPGGRAYALEFTLGTHRANLSKILKEIIMNGAIRYINDSVSGLKT